MRHTAAAATMGTVNSVHQPADPGTRANSRMTTAAAPKAMAWICPGCSITHRKGARRGRWLPGSAGGVVIAWGVRARPSGAGETRDGYPGVACGVTEEGGDDSAGCGGARRWGAACLT